MCHFHYGFLWLIGVKWVGFGSAHLDLAIRTGTSFYPKDVPQKKFQEYYASQLSAVEIDYTFYRMPTVKTLENWKAATPPDFRFALKASRRIAHWERLRVPSEALDYLLETLPRLEDRLGILLYQLPPNVKLDAERLEQRLLRPATLAFDSCTWVCQLDSPRSVSFESLIGFWQVCRIRIGRSPERRRLPRWFRSRAIFAASP